MTIEEVASFMLETIQTATEGRSKNSPDR
jgi:hypothetical protein